MTGLKQWLASLQLEGHYDRLAEERVDLDVLTDLTEADLAALGIPLGDRKRMMRGIEGLRQRHETPESPASDVGKPAEGPSPALFHDQEEVRQLTLLFSDLVGSTQLSTTLDLETYRDAIRTYQLCCSDLVRSHFGFVAQFLGDGVVAYFGYPTAEEDDAERAVSAGLEITREVAHLEVKAARHVALQARVGIATGDVLVSDLAGDRLAIKGAVLGDIPNLAARLQTMAQPGQVIVSGRTRRLLGGQFDCHRLGERQIKGFDAAQEIWLVQGVQESTSRFSARSRGEISPIVGRDEELELLQHRWSSAQAGQGQVVLISGEAGVGKSRLGEWLCDTAASQPHYRMSYQCSSYHRNSPFFPILVQIARAAGIVELDSDDEKLDKLERLLARGTDDVPKVAPLFARLLSIPFEHRYGPISQSSEEIKERTTAALLEQLFGLAAKEPVLVFFEDLQWIDPSTEELLDLLVEQIADRPVLLLCTYRPEYESAWVGRAEVSHLSLSRLDRRRALELVTRIAGQEKLPQEVVEQIVSRTEGVPLFIEELTKAVLEQHRLAGNGSPEDVALPSSLKDLLMAKLDSLSSAREVVPLCAAIGRSFSYRLLLAVSQLPEKAVRPILEQLKHSQILVQRGEYPYATFTFRHALIQEAAYDTMLASRARALHARIADVLATQLTDIARARPEVVAQHLSRAGRTVEARDQWQAAARIAIDRSANVEACAHLRQALAENDRLEESPERTAAEISLREMMREPIELCGWGSEEIELNLRRLHELREQQGSREELFSVVYGSCGTHLLVGSLGEAAAETERMASLAEETGDPAQEILTVHTKALIAFLSGRFEDATAGFDREIAALRPEHAPGIRRYYIADPAIVARTMQAWALTLSGQDARAESRIVEAERLIAAQEQGFSRAYGLAIIASIRQTQGGAEAARRLADEAWQIAHDERVPYWEAWASVVRGWAMVATGDVAEGLATLREGLDAYVRTGARQMLPYGRTLLADACSRAGRTQEALQTLEELEQEEATNEVRFFDGERRRIAEALRDGEA